MSRLEPHAEPPWVRQVERWNSLIPNGFSDATDDPFDEDPRERAMLYDIRDVEGRPD